jgi:hypothetical protein
MKQFILPIYTVELEQGYSTHAGRNDCFYNEDCTEAALNSLQGRCRSQRVCRSPLSFDSGRRASQGGGHPTGGVVRTHSIRERNLFTNLDAAVEGEGPFAGKAYLFKGSQLRTLRLGCRSRRPRLSEAHRVQLAVSGRAGVAFRKNSHPFHGRHVTGSMRLSDGSHTDRNAPVPVVGLAGLHVLNTNHYIASYSDLTSLC